MSVRPTLDGVRAAMEGAVPPAVATCDLDGVPNVSYLSQVEYVDPQHLALSFQFFNKTRRNVLVNPRARLLMVHPDTGARYRLSLQYLRTETDGPLFERMKARLAGIASHTGMAGVFRLLGSDVYRVLDIEEVPGNPPSEPAPVVDRLAAVRRLSERYASCTSLIGVLNSLWETLERGFEIGHAMLFMYDTGSASLYTVGSRGYEASGVGAEIPLGRGVVGTAAQARTPIRIGYFTQEYIYSRAIREQVSSAGMAAQLDTEIPLPGLPGSRSQLAVPMISGGALLGVLFVESPRDLAFDYQDEDALVVAAALTAAQIRMLDEQDSVDQGSVDQGSVDQDSPDRNVRIEDTPAAAGRTPAPAGEPVTVRFYSENGSVFLDDRYLIKGVAGEVLWALVQDYSGKGVTDFSNRALRLDPRIHLPDVSDNLGARLLLLQRRLEEHRAPLRIERTGRGRLRLCVRRPLVLETS
ncbi:MAG: GAF domain-containing protein [Arenicellales bacterium]